MMRKKAVSPIISAVLLIAIVFGLASLISPWAFNIATDVSNQTGENVQNQITCQSAKYDFVTSFTSNGINHSISTNSDKIEVMIVNTGSVNLHTFSLEIMISNSSSIIIKHLAINETYQKTPALPLKPGYSALLSANITENIVGVLTNVKVLNGECPNVFITQDV